MASLGSLLLARLEEGSIVIWRFAAFSSSHAVVSLSSTSANHVFDDKNSKLSPILSLEPCMQSSTIVYAGLAMGTIQVWDVASTLSCQVMSGAHSKPRGELDAVAGPNGTIEKLQFCPNCQAALFAGRDEGNVVATSAKMAAVVGEASDGRGARGGACGADGDDNNGECVADHARREDMEATGRVLA
ncbi:hypothetical protein L7F22_010607 [Adiantum nelumboides]|nr:hypothetical protein [Adiantum nelumboides]